MRTVMTLGLVASVWLAAVAMGHPGAGVAAQSGAPLPDSDAFFAEVRARLASNDRIQSHLSFKERATELKLNPFGRMGTGPLVLTEVYPSADEALTYRRVVERDGHPVPPAEIAEQDAKYRRTLAEWQRRIARQARSERDARTMQDADLRARDQAQLREALDLFVFTMEERSSWEGQPAIVIGFAPRKDGKPRSREGRIASVFAGRAWIHEFDYEVMHVEANSMDGVSIGYGLIARLHRGSAVSFSRRKIDGAWLPVETRFEGTGRALMVRSVDIRFRREYFDYRPFESSALPAALGWTR